MSTLWEAVPEQEVTEVQDGDEESPQLTDGEQKGLPAEDQNVSFRLNLSDDSDEDESSTNELVNIEVEEGPSADRLESVQEASSEENWDGDERRADTSDGVENGDSESQWKVMPTTVTESLEEEVANENVKGHNSKKPNKHHSKKVSDPKKKPHRCELCNKGFLCKSYLERHQRVHSREKPHQCKYCNKHYALIGDLNRHERSHTGEQPYKCDYCDKRFSRSDNCKIHERTHTGKKPYKCTQCNKEFSQNGHLIAHQRIHTGDKPYKCDYCDKRFIRSDHCKKHECTHTGE